MTTTRADVVVASTPDDAHAVEAVRQHHAELAGRLGVRVERLLQCAGSADTAAFATARRLAAEFCATELLPHAAAEEESLYPAAATSDRARLLVDAMVAEHRVIGTLVEEITTGGEPVRVAAAAYALKVLFETHLGKENDLVLPLVAADPTVSLAGVLAGMHELLGEHDPARDALPAHDSGGCGCGEPETAAPELDVRAVPHAIRHATVFGAFDAIPAGGTLVLVAPHDPLPLLDQLRERASGNIDVSYLDRGPEAWRLRLTRG